MLCIICVKIYLGSSVFSFHQGMVRTMKISFYKRKIWDQCRFSYSTETLGLVLKTMWSFNSNKKALSSVESCVLGDKIIGHEEVIRPLVVVLLSSEPHAVSEKVKLCSRPTVTQKKNERLLSIKEAINFTGNRISSLKGFQFYFVLYWWSCILQVIYFLYRFPRFVSPKINHMFITRLICIQWKFTTADQLASPLKFCSAKLFFFSITEVITCSKVINAFKQ